MNLDPSVINLSNLLAPLMDLYLFIGMTFSVYWHDQCIIAKNVSNRTNPIFICDDLLAPHFHLDAYLLAQQTTIIIYWHDHCIIFDKLEYTCM